MTILATLLALAAPASAQAAPPPPAPYWRRVDCAGWHRERVARRWLRRHVRSERPYLDEARVRRVRRCVSSRADALRLRRDVRRWRKWRQTYAHRWPIRFHRLPLAWQNWARAVSYCESHNYRYASNGTHHSYFQWAWSTWVAASAGWGAPASPYDASWHLQAVIAVAWAQRAGTSQWVCSPW